MKIIVSAALAAAFVLAFGPPAAGTPKHALQKRDAATDKGTDAGTCMTEIRHRQMSGTSSACFIAAVQRCKAGGLGAL